MLRRNIFILVTILLIGISLAAPADHSYAYSQTSKPTSSNIPLSEDELKESLKKHGVSDEEINKIINTGQQENQDGATTQAIHYAAFNASCANSVYAYYRTGYGNFNHWFERWDGAIINDYYGFESRSPNGGWWLSTAPGGTYRYSWIYGNPIVGHDRLGCGTG